MQNWMTGVFIFIQWVWIIVDTVDSWCSFLHDGNGIEQEAMNSLQYEKSNKYKFSIEVNISKLSDEPEGLRLCRSLVFSGLLIRCFPW
jgi:hypothetical protein